MNCTTCHLPVMGELYIRGVNYCKCATGGYPLFVKVPIIEAKDIVEVEGKFREKEDEKRKETGKAIKGT